MVIANSRSWLQVVSSAALVLVMSMGSVFAEGNNSDPRPRLESYARYADFLSALTAWEDRQTRQPSKQTELPQQRGTLSQMDQFKLQNAFVSHPILVTPVAKKPKKIETVETAVKKAPKIDDNDDNNLTLQSNPEIQSSDSSTLSSTAVSGALGATAAGANGVVVRDKLQGNVDSVNLLNNTLQQDKQQTPTQPAVGVSYSFTTVVGTTSLPNSAAVNVQNRTIISGGMIPH